MGRRLGIFPACPKTSFVPGGATTRDKRGGPFVPGAATTQDKRAFCPGSWLHPGQKVFLGGPEKFPARGPPLVPGRSTTRDKRGRFPSFPPNVMFVFVSFYFSFKIGFHLLIQLKKIMIPKIMEQNFLSLYKLDTRNKNN